MNILKVIRKPLQMLFILGWLSTSFPLYSIAITDFEKALEAQPNGNLEGLSQGLVRCLLQDQEGYIWIGTKDGLNRYDGNKVRVFRGDFSDSTSIKDNYIVKLAEDPRCFLWGFTNNSQVFYFDKKTERFQTINLPRRNPILIDIQCRDKLLLVTYLGKVALYDIANPKKPKQIFDKTQTASSLVNHAQLNFTVMLTAQCHLQNKDSLWIFSEEGLNLFYRKSTGNWLEHRFGKILPIEPGTYVSWYSLQAVPQKNTLVISDDHKIYLFDYKKEQLKECPASGDKLSGPTNFQHQVAILSSSWGRISIFDFTTLTKQTCITPGAYSALLDRSGVLWIGTAGRGMYCIDKRQASFRNYSSLKFNFCRNREGYFDAIRDTFSMQSGNEEAVTSMPLDLLFNAPRLSHGSQKHFWFYSTVLNPFNSDKTGLTKNQVAYLEALDKQHAFPPSVNQYCLLDANDKTSLTLQFLNVSTHQIDHITSVPIDNTSEYPFVSDIYETAKKQIWMTSIHGLLCYNYPNRTWQKWPFRINSKNSPSAEILFALCPDPKYPDSILWIGTNGGGLNKFNIAKGTFEYYNTSNGLPNNVIYGILPDALNNLWISTNRGISCLRFTKEDRSTFSVSSFSSRNGLINDEFNRYNYLRTGDDELLFAGVAGFCSFKPSQVLNSGMDFPVVLTGLSLFNNPFDFHSDTSVMNAPIQYAKSITLAFSQNMITLEFSRLEYSKVVNTSYQYRLEGFNVDWIDTKGNNTATFTNLDPGTYTFRVRASINEGEWSKKEASIVIHILPPWWATWWFRLLMGGLISGALYGLYFFRLRQLQALDKLRQSIAHDLHDEVGSTMSSIHIASRMVQSSSEIRSATTRGLIDQISKNSQQSLESMNDIVWTLNAKYSRFEDISNRMRMYSVETLEPLGCNFHFKISQVAEEIKLNIDERKNLYLFFKESINNVAKYSEATNCKATIELLPGKIIALTIQDDGIGFNTSTPSIDTKKGGLGLQSMRSRADALKGEFRIKSDPNQGTTISLHFKHQNIY